MSELTLRLRRAILRRLMPAPVAVRHAEYSMLFSADDAVGLPSARLLELALAAVAAARTVSLDEVDARRPATSFFPNVWPGEHYKLLAGLVVAMQPRRIVEIGTAAGTSALTLLKYLPPAGRVDTFDVVPWTGFPGSYLTVTDFADGRLVQHVADLTDAAVFERHRARLAAAELIFVDAQKDGRMEQVFIDRFRTVDFAAPPIVVFDDIRLWNMLRIWRQLDLPKLDLTSFGHWSGTGLVDWQTG